MGYIGTNLLPILAATAVGLLIGIFYAATTGRGGMGGQPRWPLLAVAMVAEFWLSCILAGALILAPAGAASPWVMALGSAVVIWIGFVLPTVVVSHGFRGQTVGPTAGDALHWLVVMVAQAAILQGIGLAHP